MQKPQLSPELVHRAGHEMRAYFLASAYLYVCFGALLLHKVGVLRSAGVDLAPWGFALIKALILGKFMLVGRALRFGERFRGKPLIYPVLYKTAVFVGFLFVLDVIEELLVGWIHGRAVTTSLSAVAGSNWLQIVSSCFLLFLILLPYYGLHELGWTLGEGRLAQLFLGRPPAPAETRLQS